jgi:hypothetical protein
MVRLKPWLRGAGRSALPDRPYEGLLEREGPSWPDR